MPLVLDGDDRDRWLFGSVDEGHALVRSPASLEERAELIVAPVSSWVNDVRHDDARCLEAASEREARVPAQATLRFG